MIDPLQSHMAFDDDGRMQQTIDPPTDFERDKSLGFMEDSEVSMEVKRQVMELASGVLRAVNQWTLSTIQPDAIAQRAAAVMFVLRREDLPPGLDKMPALAARLGVCKQNLHYHVKQFRAKFGIHINERSAEARHSMSESALKAWSKRKATKEIEAEDAE